MEICFCQPSRHPSQRKTFIWHLYNVGPTSKTLGRCCINVMQIFCVSWVAFYYILDRTRAVYNNRVVPVGLLPLWYLFQLTSPRLICRTQARISTVEPDHRRIHLIFWSPHRPPISKPKVMCMLRVVSGGTSQWSTTFSLSASSNIPVQLFQVKSIHIAFTLINLQLFFFK